MNAQPTLIKFPPMDPDKLKPTVPIKVNLLAAINTDISCVGTAQPPGFQNTLIAPQWVLANKHYGADQWGANVVFRIAGQDIPYSGENHWAGVGSDLVLCKLSNPAPPACVPPFIFPVNYTDYLPNKSAVGMQCFWLHKSADRIDNIKVVNMTAFGGWEIMVAYGNKSTCAAAGDSGSPCFMLVNGKLVLLFATTDGFPEGAFVSGANNLKFIESVIPPGQLKILDLGGYQIFNQ